jgi:hypothetical protein
VAAAASWLKWLGCHMVRRIESFGAQSLPFIEFASFRTGELAP